MSNPIEIGQTAELQSTISEIEHDDNTISSFFVKEIKKILANWRNITYLIYRLCLAFYLHSLAKDT